jgi:hypothetical protein
MKKIDLGQAIGLVANVAVLIGILLLVYELRQNQITMQAQARSAVAQGFNDHMYHVTADQEISDLWRRGNAGEQLTPEQRGRWTLLAVALLRYYENVHYQYRQGLYSEDEFRGQRESWRQVVFRSDGFRRFFCGSRPQFSTEFVAEIEALLIEECD